MQISSYIIDNFYSDVDKVREFALQQEYPVSGNYPGRRTKSFLNDSMKEVIESVVSPYYGKVTYWSEEQYTGSYQFTTSKDRSWVHADQTTKWAGVCYLTPDAPLSSGTALYRYKETKEYERQDNNSPQYDGYDYTKWEQTDYVANKYNRIVMYRGNLYHASLDYFGSNLQNGRLFQTFFFNTEY